MFLSSCRKAVDTFAPPLGRSYRLLRDATHRCRCIRTKFGFGLAGDPSMAKGDWEVEEVQVFLDLIESHDVVVDIGANVGFYSCLAASRGKHTLAFEPVSRNLNFLYRNLWENHFRDVEVFPVGLARQPGLGRIYGYGGVASLVPGWAQAREAHSSLVSLTTLDTIVARRFQDRKMLVKMDVEGFELEVLAGATETLRRNPKPTWLVEILLRGGLVPGGMSRKFMDAFQVFWEAGYHSRMLDAARTPVGPADVSRWVANGAADSETHDFMFSAD
jgi:FkbM family methyltransferase